MGVTLPLGRWQVEDPALLTAAIFGYGVAGSMTIPFRTLSLGGG